jgi:hypothetical protein
MLNFCAEMRKQLHTSRQHGYIVISSSADEVEVRDVYNICESESHTANTGLDRIMLLRQSDAVVDPKCFSAAVGSAKAAPLLRPLVPARRFAPATSTMARPTSSLLP